MGKPLLTDEVIEKARRKQAREREFGYYSPQQKIYDIDEYGDEQFDENWDEEYEGYQEGQTIRIPVEQSIVKSRRIETIKREAFRSKVNKILFWVVILVILFLLAVFNL